MNLLLVDDEVISIHGLRAAIDWDKLGIINLYYAFNVSDAKEIIQTGNINILICDIEMPGGNGFELMHWIRNENYSVVTIILTCHADFSYATEGIRSGVFQYLLKPVDIDELKNIIKKAIGQVKQNLDHNQKLKYERLWFKNKELIKERFWHDIVTGMYQNSDYSYIEWTADLRSVELTPPITYLPVLIFILSYEAFIRDDVLLAFSIKNVISELILFNFDSIPTITLSKREYLVLIPLGMAQDINEMQRRCRHFEASCLKHLKMTTQTHQGSPVRFSDLAKEVQKLRGHSLSLRYANGDAKLPTVTVVDKIKEIVHNNVNQIITRESIAKEIFLNPDYLSKLFKKETGLALSDYITRIKVEEAKRLLTNTHKSIGEITADLGYTNFSYFSQMFKKETNMSPNQYRYLHK
ncbi:MAG TPA: response regulator [Clostridiales bacterium]|nr:response regulator [Clostridiales bacterium]